MQSEMDFTPDALQGMEPPEEALAQILEPIDRPLNCSELLFYVFTISYSLVARLFAWTPLHIVAMGTGGCFIALELFLLCIPPRFSLHRLLFVGSVIFEAKIFWW